MIQIGCIAGFSMVFLEDQAITALGNPVCGNMSAAQAMQTALAGTGLGWRFSNADRVQIFAAAAIRLPISLANRRGKLTSVPQAFADTTGATFDQGETERGTIYACGFTVSNYIFDGVDASDHGEHGGNQASTALYDRLEIVRGATCLVKSAVILRQWSI